ncbi:MAG: penicillin acylase family protein [Oleiphilaceae bacterium]|nr:penicillin acylase family protein [Oleiphilaceae bacterium]
MTPFNPWKHRATTLGVVVLSLTLAGCPENASDNASEQSAATAGAPPDNPGRGNGRPDNRPPVKVPDNFDPFNRTGLFLSIMPPGQGNSPDGSGDQPHFTDQLPIYENLSFTQPGELSATQDLTQGFFKDASFRPEGSFTETTEVANGQFSSRIGRDEFGVPHIYGETREDVKFGVGYASAQDRLFVMDALRHIGRGRLSDLAGAAGGNYSQDRDVGLIAGYDEAEIDAQILQTTRRFGETGDQIALDADAFAAGINQYIGELGNTVEMPLVYQALLRPDGPAPFTRRDILAVATLVQATFAVGGGGEHRQVELLNALEQQFDTDTACDLWRDLRHFDDPEKPLTTELTFETQSPATVDDDACPLKGDFAGQFPGAAVFDNGSLQKRDILRIEDCFIPNVDCPNYGRTITDDSPLSAEAIDDLLAANETVTDSVADADPGEPAPSVSLAALDSGFNDRDNTQTAATDTRTLAAEPVSELSEEELAQGQEYAREVIAQLQVALNSDTLPEAMSNALLVNGDQTASGSPLAVFGPQTGYFAPQLLLEFAQHGGGIHTRGMSFAGLPYVVIGRGVDFAWSATSAGTDIVDVRALRLCDAGVELASDFLPDSGYLHNGQCKPFFERQDQWTAEYHAGAMPPQDGSSVVGQAVTRTILRAPEYGPIFAKATVDGEPVALAEQRSTFFGEIDSAVPFLATETNDITDPQSFYEEFNRLTGTFSWFYVDPENIAFFNSGLLPIRANGIHPDLPQWGTGQYDWKQTGTGEINEDFSIEDNFLPLEAHPRETNPEKGFFANWNNALAPGFWANDTQNNYGVADRSQILEKRLIAFRDEVGPVHTPGSLVEIMADAAHTDLRGQEIVSDALAVLGDVSQESPEVQRVVALMGDWVVNGTRDFGAQRRDRDGPSLDTASLEYEDRAAAVFMDTWWDTMINRTLPQVVAVEDNMIGSRHDLPNRIGSAFNGGYYSFVGRVLQMALDESAHPYDALKCAGSDQRSDCRDALLASIQDSFDALGSSDPDDWDGRDQANGSNPDESREQDDAIGQSPIGIGSVPNIHWQNRPTFQQVVQPQRRRQ